MKNFVYENPATVGENLIAKGIEAASRTEWRFGLFDKVKFAIYGSIMQYIQPHIVYMWLLSLRTKIFSTLILLRRRFFVDECGSCHCRKPDNG